MPSSPSGGAEGRAQPASAAEAVATSSPMEASPLQPSLSCCAAWVWVGCRAGWGGGWGCGWGCRGDRGWLVGRVGGEAPGGGDNRGVAGLGLKGGRGEGGDGCKTWLPGACQDCGIGVCVWPVWCLPSPAQRGPAQCISTAHLCTVVAIIALRQLPGRVGRLQACGLLPLQGILTPARLVAAVRVPFLPLEGALDGQRRCWGRCMGPASAGCPAGCSRCCLVRHGRVAPAPVLRTVPGCGACTEDAEFGSGRPRQ